MRYWGILLAKLAVAGAFFYGIWAILRITYKPPFEIARWNHSPFPHDLKFTAIMLLFTLLVQGVLFLIIWDQRYRCRSCGRRLRMPIETGRYGQMLLYGRPKIEYICTYGHGTLKVPELQFSGRELSDWEPHDDDIWKELYAVEKSEKE